MRRWPFFARRSTRVPCACPLDPRNLGLCDVDCGLKTTNPDFVPQSEAFQDLPRSSVRGGPSSFRRACRRTKPPRGAPAVASAPSAAPEAPRVVGRDRPTLRGLGGAPMVGHAGDLTRERLSHFFFPFFLFFCFFFAFLGLFVCLWDLCVQLFHWYQLVLTM